MWWFYREKKYLLTSIIVIILDGVIVYFMPSFFNKINCMYPMLTISLISFLCHNNKKWHIILLGFIYDLLYTDIFLYNTLIFLLLATINLKIIKYFKPSLILYLILTILNIIIYDSVTFSLILITRYQDILLTDLLYKIKNSMALNIMSVFVYFFMFKKEKLKHKM